MTTTDTGRSQPGQLSTRTRLLDTVYCRSMAVRHRNGSRVASRHERAHVSGDGNNIWANSGHFHYVWKGMSGDVTLKAPFDFVGTQPSTDDLASHRKACLVIRQIVDSDAV